MGEIRDFKSGKSGKPARESAPRRLAAIVAGDIAGYSRLMEIDEEGTHGRVKRIERSLIEPSITSHYGKLVKTTGDGFIAIFDSPVEAVRCAIVIQQDMVRRNASLPKHHWIEYRIGVNLGDVIIEATDIYGDGVNIASRLESIAEPGQVFISGGIYEQVKYKLVCGYELLGERKVKNIADPIRVYRVLPDPTAFNRIRKRRENLLIVLLESHSADHRKQCRLVYPLGTARQGRRSGVCPGFGDAKGALAAIPRETSSAATSALARGAAGRRASSAASSTRSIAGSSCETSSAAAAARVSGTKTEPGGPRARNENASRRKLHDGQQ